MTINPTDLDPDTLRKLSEMDKASSLFRKPITCENRTMRRGMDGMSVRVEGDPVVYVYPFWYDALLHLIGEKP